MLLPWDAPQGGDETMSPQERMKAKLQRVAANRSARQQSGGGSRAAAAAAAAGGGAPVRRVQAYSFAADDKDHCETPAQAYEDIAPILRLLVLPAFHANVACLASTFSAALCGASSLCAES